VTADVLREEIVAADIAGDWEWRDLDVQGRIDLSDHVVDHPIRLVACTLTDGIHLRGARLRHWCFEKGAARSAEGTDLRAPPALELGDDGLGGSHKARGPLAIQLAQAPLGRLAAFPADSQVPWSVDALGGPVTEPAWRSKPAWYLVAQDDLMIDPRLQRSMAAHIGATVAESPGSHSV
jgi:hypothetical protein